MCEKHAMSYLLLDLANIGHKSGKRKDVAPISDRFRSLEYGMVPAVTCLIHVVKLNIAGDTEPTWVSSMRVQNF